MKNKHNMKRIKDMLCQYAKACKKQAKIRLTLKNKHNCKKKQLLRMNISVTRSKRSKEKLVA